MRKIKFIAAAVAAFALVACVMVGCTSSGGSGSASASASGSAASGSASASATSASASAAASSASASSGPVKFIVGFDATYPPFGYKDADGNYVGFDLDLAKAVCEMNGWEFEAKPIDWDAKDLELDSGNITCIWNGFTYERREDQYSWSKPYWRNAQVYVVSKDSTIKTQDDMAGKKVVTQAGSTAYGLLTDDEEGTPIEAAFDGGKVATVPEYGTAFMQLESGAVDVVACDLSVANYQMAQKEGVFVQLEQALNAESYAVGFKLGNDEMPEIVTQSLIKLYEDGTVAKLCEKYNLDIADWILK